MRGRSIDCAAKTAALVALALLAGCRTAPVDGSNAADAAIAARDLASAGLPDFAAAPGGVVSCGNGQSCSIAAGEHCCDQQPLTCQTAPCTGANQYDCDGPEDCGGQECCFPIRNAFAAATCAPSCDNGTVLCHQTQDCPQGTVCCKNFVLGADVGLCLGACD